MSVVGSPAIPVKVRVPRALDQAIRDYTQQTGETYSFVLNEGARRLITRSAFGVRTRKVTGLGTNPARNLMWTVRLSDVEAKIFQESIEARGMERSDAIREALMTWRTANNDRHEAMEAWVGALTKAYGDAEDATFRLNDTFDIEVVVAGAVVFDVFTTQSVRDVNGVQVWVGDPRSDARAFVGKLPSISGSSMTVPIRSLASLGADWIDTAERTV